VFGRRPFDVINPTHEQYNLEVEHFVVYDNSKHSRTKLMSQECY